MFEYIDGEYEVNPKWMEMSTQDYLVLLKKELESKNGGEQGMNLLTLPFTIEAVGTVILSAVALFKALGASPTYTAEVITNVLIKSAPNEVRH
jgi:hypothetical protein